MNILEQMRPWLGLNQYLCCRDALRGEEAQWFRDKLFELNALITIMPKTYEQDGMGDGALVTLHYFAGGRANWWITEKDSDPDGDGQVQAFGLVNLSGGPKREPIPQSEVLGWLAANWPDLHEVAETERAWVWLPVDLRGDHNKAKREALKEFGFRFAFRGHPLPSGKNGTWGHCCMRPMPFKRKGQRKEPNHTNHNQQASEPDPIEAEMLAFING